MKILASALALSFIAVAANAAEPVVAATKEQQLAMLKTGDAQVQANKKIVFDMWRSFLSAHQIDAADKYLAPEYHQHNPNAETGLAGVKAYFTALKATPTPTPDTIEGLVSMVGEGDRVVVSLVREGKDKDGKPYTTTWFDMFRIANGKIVEHWDTATKP